MDNGALIAITSISTIFLTGILNLMSKRLDSVQKTEEHQLTIRSAYVIKKIEAGQAFIINNNLGFHSSTMFVNYLESLKARGKPRNDLFDKVKLFDEKLVENALGTSDFSDLYFDIDAYAAKLEIIGHEREKQARKLNALTSTETANETEFLEQLEVLITLVKDSVAIRIEMNKMVRNELAHYDIFKRPALGK